MYEPRHISNPIVLHLMSSNHGYTYEEALTLLTQMREDVFNGANPEEILYNIGLEPDYLEDLIFI